jgi:hypothetical protein
MFGKTHFRRVLSETHQGRSGLHSRHVSRQKMPAALGRGFEGENSVRCCNVALILWAPPLLHGYSGMINLELNDRSPGVC